MFAYKNKYYIYIDNTKTLDLNLIKKRDKFIVIYRNNETKDNKKKIENFRKKCKRKGIYFYVANNYRLAVDCKADGLYLSSHNKKKYYNFKNIIGSAHNFKEIYQKKKQGCSFIVLSRLFKTDYSFKRGFLGVVKFNRYTYLCNDFFIALGGIKNRNLNSIKNVNTTSIALMSEVKKKPAIISRLF